MKRFLGLVLLAVACTVRCALGQTNENVCVDKGTGRLVGPSTNVFDQNKDLLNKAVTNVPAVATTAGYATNAGTATFTMMSATTAGYATNAGAAAVATTSGYATNAGAAAVATTSGYATNAGTAATAITANSVAAGAGLPWTVIMTPLYTGPTGATYAIDFSNTNVMYYCTNTYAESGYGAYFALTNYSTTGATAKIAIRETSTGTKALGWIASGGATINWGYAGAPALLSNYSVLVHLTVTSLSPTTNVFGEWR